MNAPKLIKVKEKIADNLVTRNSADKLFDYINSQRDKTIILDFKSVKFATRSFMHEYLLKKSDTRKKITERNMSKELYKMLKIVSESEENKNTQLELTFKSLPLSSKTH
ncbi:STAS-like domain-containing protein [Candidatus Marsarchaeota archaeon]|nr:STAS-like domain-containing protein [Candidatus Marsarchaeota archaeon]